MILGESEEQLVICGGTGRHKGMQRRLDREQLSQDSPITKRQILEKQGLRYSTLQRDGSIDALLNKYENELADMQISN